jgi:hypothetical protein
VVNGKLEESLSPVSGDSDVARGTDPAGHNLGEYGELSSDSLVAKRQLQGDAVGLPSPK